MKRVLFTVLIAFTATFLYANTYQDTTKRPVDSTAKKDNDFSLDYSLPNHNHTYHRSYYPKWSIGITFSRFDLGYATLIDNGSFTLSPQNQFLRYNQAKTSNVGFDLIQAGVRLSSTFKIYVSGGIDWTHIRLRDNITILPNQPVLTYRPDTIVYSKNRFSSTYLRIPLSFDFRTRANAGGRWFHFVFGPEGGFLLDGRVKQISQENGKQKIDDTYHYATFRYGAFGRVGYGIFGLFAKYYFNDMFEDSPQQAGLKNFSFGLMVGF
ncbi:MAG TPA: outer membrane beta-barrel protein [Mucilaginibacter sp.]|jgi:hypothetical protein